MIDKPGDRINFIFACEYFGIPPKYSTRFGPALAISHSCTEPHLLTSTHTKHLAPCDSQLPRCKHICLLDKTFALPSSPKPSPCLYLSPSISSQPSSLALISGRCIRWQLHASLPFLQKSKHRGVIRGGFEANQTHRHGWAGPTKAREGKKRQGENVK